MAFSKRIVALAGIAAACLSATPLFAQNDVHDPVLRYARALAEPGTFWLDSNEDREVIRYTTPRDVSLCLPRPEGVGAANHGYPVTVKWDQSNEAILYPGNCLYFDARRVTLKPASPIPQGVTLTGRIETTQPYR